MSNIDELKENIKTNIKNIKDKNNINTLSEGLTSLRKQMDNYDGLWKNTNDWVKRLFTFGNKKDLCIIELYDIVIDFSNYNDKDKQIVLTKLTELSKIKDRSFLDKIISVLRAS